MTVDGVLTIIDSFLLLTTSFQE